MEQQNQIEVGSSPKRDYVLNRARRFALSEKQVEIAALIAEGLSNKEIGERLHVGEKTVKFHLSNVFKKVQVKTRFALALLLLDGYPGSAA